MSKYFKINHIEDFLYIRFCYDSLLMDKFDMWYNKILLLNLHFIQNTTYCMVSLLAQMSIKLYFDLKNLLLSYLLCVPEKVHLPFLS